MIKEQLCDTCDNANYDSVGIGIYQEIFAVECTKELDMEKACKEKECKRYSNMRNE